MHYYNDTFLQAYYILKSKADAYAAVQLALEQEPNDKNILKLASQIDAIKIPDPIPSGQMEELD